VIARFFKKLVSDGHILAVLMIGLTAIITHGLMIPRLGYYYDDWYMLWSGATRGAGGIVSLFSIDRPFMGVIYSGFYRIIGDNIAGWHVFTLLIRITGGIAFYWILNLVWPGRKSVFVFASMIFVVFPGFLAEPNAATKINHLIGYGAALFSISLTLQAVKTSSTLWKFVCALISTLLFAFYIWIYEYMVGLELMRLTLLYLMLWQGDRTKTVTTTKKVLFTYIPYVIVSLIFLFWRVKIFEGTRPSTDFKGVVAAYRADFVGMLFRLIFQVGKDFFSASTFAWFVQPYYLLAKAENAEIVIALLFAISVVALAVVYIFINKKRASHEDEENTSPLVMILTGALITLGAVFPVVLLNKHLDLMDPYKGYALHPSAGVMIMIIGIILMLKPKFRTPVLVIVLGVSVATQSMNIQKWADFWDVQRSFWWQLTWRAPNIRNETLIMAYLPEGFIYQQDYEVWGPVNLIYRPEPENYPYIQSEVLNRDTLIDVSTGLMLYPHVRDIYLPRYFKNLLLISQPTTNSCIHAIDGSMPAYSANERFIVEQAGKFSNINFIETSGNPPIPPSEIFGQEPAHSWCYYYQQASLARQVGDWRKVGELYQATLSAGLKPGDASEYFVFIEGLVNLGRTDEAKKIVNREIAENEALKYSLCKSLASAPVYPASFGYQWDAINKLICQ
jgi:hypothetical protein